jgi:DNA helicase TIP49 (TBP-interacting protein)
LEVYVNRVIMWITHVSHEDHIDMLGVSNHRVAQETRPGLVSPRQDREAAAVAVAAVAAGDLAIRHEP